MLEVTLGQLVAWQLRQATNDVAEAKPECGQVQMDALDAACQLHTRAVLDILEARATELSAMRGSARIRSSCGLIGLIVTSYQDLAFQEPGW